MAPRNSRKRYNRKPVYRRKYGRKRYIARKSKVNHLTTKRFVIKLSQPGDDTFNYAGYTTTFSLSDVPNPGEFTSLFDQYMIKGIQYRWVIRRDPAFATTAANKGFSPRVGWVHDHDSVQPVTAFTDIQQYPYYKEVNFNSNYLNTKWYYLKPAVCNSVYNGVYNGYSAMWRKYLDSGYPAVPHYGIRAFYEGLYLGVTLNLECKYIIKLKSVI